MTYYLGLAGSLVALPDPESGLSMPTERVGGTHQLLSGARVRDTVGRSRSWQLSWTAIDLDAYSLLEAFEYTVGPFYFLDPEQRNLFIPNVATGTDANQNTIGFTQGTATVFQSGTDAHGNWADGPFPAYGTHTLYLGVGTSGAGGNILVTGTQGIPVIPGLPYTFSAYTSLATTAFGVFAQFYWKDLSGAFVGSNVSGSVVTGSGRTVATGTAPSGAAWAGFELVLGGANSTGSTQMLYTDGWQFEQAATATKWRMGAGAPLVTVESLNRTTPLAGICDAQMTLVQVG